MSNFRAIATVTATLKELLQASAMQDVHGTTVKTSRPDSNSLAEPVIHLCLYQVVPNAALRNDDLPTRRSNGSGIQRPRVALDLHYLLSFYGNEQELVPQLLMGSVARTLHAQPILARESIRRVIGQDMYLQLKSSNLAEQVEQVKFTPLGLSLEELSKIWSIFFQIPYTLSMAYQGSVVLIEDEAPTQSSLPVRSTQSFAFPFQQPVIEQAFPLGGANLPVLADSTLRIVGRSLGKVNEVRLGQATLQPTADNDTQFTLVLGSAGGLRAGVQSLQAFQNERITAQAAVSGTALPARIMAQTAVQSGVASNAVPMILRPALLSAADGTPDIRLDVQGDPLRSGTVTVRLKPLVGREQRALLFLNQLNQEQPISYSFEALPRTEDGDTLSFAVALPTGSYLVRVQVDGAESPLDVDNDPGSPTYGAYAQPRITIV